MNPEAVILTVPVKGLSVNAAFQGRRFNTPAKTQYERTLALLLPKVKAPGPFYRVAYDFYLVNSARTDWDSPVKVFQDCLVKQGIIRDDRLILEARVRKFKADKDRIDAVIESIEVA